MSDSVDTPRYLSAEKHRTLVTLPIAVFVFGIIGAAEIRDPLVVAVLVAMNLVVPFFLILKWCRLDAQQRGFVLWRRFALFTIIFPGPLITVPYYLLASRGVAGITSVIVAVLYATALLTIEYFALFLADGL